MNELLLQPMTIVNRRGFYGTKGSNQNRPFYVIDVLVPLSEGDIKNDSFGYEVRTVFLEKEQWLKIRPEDVGRKISFTYETNIFGSAMVSGFQLVDYLILKKE